jgi:hypothetical protein
VEIVQKIKSQNSKKNQTLRRKLQNCSSKINQDDNVLPIYDLASNSCRVLPTIVMLIFVRSDLEDDEDKW